jgi:type VI secretion system protein ImpF
MSDKGRLRSSLLDRLTDNDPEKKVEPAGARGVDEAGLRELVRRDLTWLFNTTHLGCTMDLAPYPEVQRSVLNFGILDLTGKTLSSVDPERLEREVREALLYFEPRLLHDSLAVQVVTGQSRTGSTALIIEISGELWAEPLPLNFHLRTEVDFESGRVALDELRPEVRRAPDGSAISRVL